MINSKNLQQYMGFAAMGMSDIERDIQHEINQIVAIMYRYGCIVMKAEELPEGIRHITISVPATSDLSIKSDDPLNKNIPKITLGKMIEDIYEFYVLIGLNKQLISFDIRNEHWSIEQYHAMVAKQEAEKEKYHD